jgi:hypothetical protein
MPRELIGVVPLRRHGRGRRRGVRILEIFGVHPRLVDPQGTQLTLHESLEPGPILPIEPLQRFDLLLKHLALGGQAADNILVALLGEMLELVSLRLSDLGEVVSPDPRIGQEFLGLLLRLVGTRVSVTGYLRCRGMCFGKGRLGLPPQRLGTGLGIPDYLSRPVTRLPANPIRLAPSAGQVFLGRSLG